MILYLPKEFFVKSGDTIIEHYKIEYDSQGIPLSMTVYDKGSYKVCQAKRTKMAGCTYVSFDKKFFIYDESGNIMKHTMFKSYYYCNDKDVKSGTVEYHYNTYEHSVTKLIKSYSVNLQKFITENSETIHEYVGRYQLCGVPQTRTPKKLVITNGKDGDNVVNTIKLMFGVYDAILYYRYNCDPKRIIIRKTETGESIIVNNTVFTLDDMDIIDNYQNLYQSKPDGKNDRYISHVDDDLDKDIINVITYNEQGHSIAAIGRKNLVIDGENKSCVVYSVLQEIDFNFYNSIAIEKQLDTSMVDIIK